jgi:hypothetical protein
MVTVAARALSEGQSIDAIDSKVNVNSEAFTVESISD